jgi:Mlc titration factor MtfA (ptsG expression regulator)
MIWPIGSRRALAIDPSAWDRLRSAQPWLEGLDSDEQSRMRELIAEFLSRKTFSGADGLEPSDEMRLTIAAQACLPVLRFGLRPYDDFVEIVVYPSAFAVKRRILDDDGLVHEFDDVLAGEAMDGGPVALSWEDASTRGVAGTNVVIHEFAHKLDLADGVADGCPPMPGPQRARWRAVLEEAYDAFVDAVDDAEAAIPPSIDPESEDADHWYQDLPLDPYAATDEAEFFAVAAEAFFVDPATLRGAFPAVYGLFVEFFGQDPFRRLADPARSPPG